MPKVGQIILSVIALGLVVTLNVLPRFNVPRYAQTGLKVPIAGAVTIVVAELAVIAAQYLLLERYPSSRGILTTLAGLIITIGSVIYAFRHVKWT